MDEETDAQHLHAKFLNRLYELAAVDLYGVNLLSLHAEHLGQRGTENVGVEQSHTVTQTGQRHGQVHRHGALAHTTLAGAHGHDVLHTGKHFSYFRTRFRLKNGSDGHLHILVHMIVDGGLGRFQRGFEERVGIAFEYERERHFHAVDAEIVVDHAALHEIFLCSGIDDGSQGVGDKFGIKCCHFCDFCIFLQK